MENKEKNINENKHIVNVLLKNIDELFNYLQRYHINSNQVQKCVVLNNALLLLSYWEEK